MIARRLVGVMVVASVVVGAQRATAQQKATSCTLEPLPTTRLSADTIAGGGQVVFAGGGVSLRCPARGITLRGDSAEHYPNREFMVGNVVYDEPRLHLTSDFLNYFPDEEKVIAVGNVNAKLPNGSTLVGPIAEFYRAVPRVRAQQQVRARSRPTITIMQKDSVGRPMEPTTVVAENVFMDGDSLIYASGQVVITRPEIGATADSVFMDQTKETMRLMRKPELKGKKDKPYTLTGELIDLFSRNRKLERVISRANAVAVSDSLTLKSDTIDLRVKNDVLDHAYAWGQSRASAVSPTQNLLADSLDVLMPGQKVQVIRALRGAFAAGKPDTVRFRVEKPDTINWLRGDTITAHFDTVATKDTAKAKGPNIRNLSASGHAHSLYHMAPSDTAERRPAINYTSARQINIAFDQQQQRIATITAVDSVTGVYVEPRADTTVRRTNAARPTPGQTPGQTPAKPPAASKPTPAVPLPPKKP